MCPILEEEGKLRLLNYQNNEIKTIRNLKRLPQLIFLDFYNNQIETMRQQFFNFEGVNLKMILKLIEIKRQKCYKLNKQDVDNLDE